MSAATDNCFVDGFHQGVLYGVLNRKRANLGALGFSLPPERTKHGLFVVGGALPALVVLSADEGFIAFYGAVKMSLLIVRNYHRFAEPVSEVPRGPVVDVQVPLKLHCGESLFCVDGEGYCKKPLVSREV